MTIEDDRTVSVQEAPVRRPPVPERGIVLPSREDSVARAASAVIGGPAGTRLASARGFWRALPVLILLATAVFSAGVVQKAHCRDEGWSSPDQFWHACYSDIPLLYSSVGLGKDDAPGLREALGPASEGHASLGQPPLAGAAMWVVGGFVKDDGTIYSQRKMFDISAVVLIVALLIGVAAIGLAAGRRPWDAAHLALSPLLLTSALISYDMLAVALLAIAILAWTREQPLVAGVFLGLATTARPVVFAVAVVALLLSLRTKQWSSSVLAFAGAVLTVILTRAALLPAAGSGIADAWKGWKGGGAGFGSLWLLPSLLSQSRPARARWWYSGQGPSAQTVTVLAIVTLALLTALVIWLVMSGRHQVGLAHLALIAVAGTLIAGKAIPPQASVILLPLIALVGLAWRDHLIWVTAEVVYFVSVWLYLGGGNRGMPAWLYLTVLLTRVVALGWLIARAVKAARLPDGGASAVAADPLPDPQAETPEADAPEADAPEADAPEAETPETPGKADPVPV